MLQRSDIEVVRSPCRVAWWVVYDGEVLEVKETKAEAEAVKEILCQHIGL